MDQYRARQRHLLTADADVPEQPAEEEHDASEAEQELARCIPGFVRALPEPYREALMALPTPRFSLGWRPSLATRFTESFTMQAGSRRLDELSATPGGWWTGG